MENQDLFEVQERIERKYKELGSLAMMKIINDAKESKMVSTATTLGRGLFQHEIYAFQQAIIKWIKEKTSKKRGCKKDYLFILNDLVEMFTDPKKVGDNPDQPFEVVGGMLSTITLSTIINFMGSYDEWKPMNNIGGAIGMAIQNEFQTRAFEKFLALEENKEIRGALAGIEKRVGAGYRKAYLSRAIKLNKFQAPKWQDDPRNNLGIELLCICAMSTRYFEFERVYGQKQVIYKPTEYFSEIWKRNEGNILSHSYKLCPMVIPPVKWESYEVGGYYGDLAQFHNLLRLKNMETAFAQDYKARLSGEIDLSNVQAAVNAIQETPWKINKKVLEVMLYYKKLGRVPCGGEVDMKGNKTNYIVIDKPAPPVAPLEKNKKYSKEVIEAYCEAMIPYYRYDSRRSALSTRATSTLGVAEEFSKYERIYFPHNMDFRGRIYPIPVFSPQGDDLTKSLLLFADVPPCQDINDIDYLAITGANLAGVDKVSYDDRIKWVYDHEDIILAVAKDPIEHEEWWMSQDEPCQMLAWCFEWARAKEWISERGSIIGFVTGFPYAQDGTCSGLQHFSAILRDPVGGQAVNLIPQDKPNDIYAQVAVKVNEILKKDSVSGDGDIWNEDTMKYKYGTKTLSQLWINYGASKGIEGGINRKVTKRPTMTLAYGAKLGGYKQQILDDTIKPAMREQGKACVFTEKNMTQAAIYMAKVIWKSVNATVTKAVEGMDWLHKCAVKVCKHSQVVTWSTPACLIVQQNYPKYEMTVTQLRCMGKRFRVYTPKQDGTIDISRQTQAVAPNFIHSMDASHLQLTVLNSVNEGIHHFAMIHDSYGCPMSQARLMYRIVRQTFIDMYTKHDVLADFRKELQELLYDRDAKEYKEILPEPPLKGDLDLNCINSSKYIFC